MPIIKQLPLTVFAEDEKARKIELTGGKGSSLAELRSIPGIKVPEAFVVTSLLSDQIFQQNPRISNRITSLDEVSSRWLKAKLSGNEEKAESWGKKIAKEGKIIEQEMNGIKLSPEMKNKIANAYSELCQKIGIENVRVAVRSSGISEDGSEFSFAGQNKTFLHQQGEKEIVKSTVECIASQFGARVIEYRNEARLKLAKESLKNKGQDIKSALATSRNFSHAESRLAVVIQEMADGQAAGIGFSIDSKTGADIIRLDVNYGLGEAIVSGSVTPDSYEIDPRTTAIIGRSLGEKAIKTVYIKGGTENVKVSLKDRKKFAVTDNIVKEVARQIIIIRDHYCKKYSKKIGLDTEFVIKAEKVWLTQARPETIAANKDPMIIEMREFAVPEKIAKSAEVIFRGGRMGSPGVAAGKVMLVGNIEEAKRFLAKNRNKDVILVTDITSPDWVPIMKKVKGIITKKGGDKCHAAIVSRELHVPCLVGAGELIDCLKNNDEVTLDTRNTKVYKDILSLKEAGENIDLREIIKNRTKTILGVNMANPDEARRMHALAKLGNKFKVSLLRAEFLLAEIGVHVNALVDFDSGKMLPGSDLYEKIAGNLSEAGYVSGRKYFIAKYSEGIAGIAAMFPNSDIVLRTTDFKTNEYKELIGGKHYEPEEENPMMGKRGLPRFLSSKNREGFKWELEAIKNARDAGYKNIKVMFPMVRDPLELVGSREEMEEGYGKGFRSAYDIMKEVGLQRGKDGLKILIMVENPANVIRLNEFIDTGIDEISIGSNDLTQFILGVDRDNEELDIPEYSEMNPAVISAIRDILRTCKKRGIKAGICGNAPSNYPEIVEMLIAEGIDSIGITADRYLATHRLVRKMEQNRKN